MAIRGVHAVAVMRWRFNPVPNKSAGISREFAFGLTAQTNQRVNQPPPSRNDYNNMLVNNN